MKKGILLGGLALGLVPVIHALTLDRIIEYKEEVFRSDKVSSDLDGYRIALITDTHYLSAEKLRGIVRKLDTLEIDLLALGGDYSPNRRHLWKSMKILSQVKVADGVYGVDGNHDDHLELYAAMRQYGIKPLSNDGEYIREGLYLGGLADLRDRDADISEAMSCAWCGGFKVLLTHSPDITMEQSCQGIDLVLSGHTHGGQITAMGLWAPYFCIENEVTKYGQRFVSGWSSSRDGVPVYVSRGVGTCVPRVFARPQVVIITLKSLE